jgi:hypothetical protein
MKKSNLLLYIVCYILLTYFFLFSQTSAADVIPASSGEVTQKENLNMAKGNEPQSAKLKPPLILSPGERSEFRDVHKIEFIWREVPAAAGYHVILARDRVFKNTIDENANVADTSYAVDNLDYGTYFFKISSVSSDGTEGPFSDILNFIIVPPPPVNIFPE